VKGVPAGPVAVGLLATIEECAQAFFPTRTFSLGDLAANLAGVVVFGWLGGLGRRNEDEKRA
jgi:polysaccharide biosynthesis protein VpsQ